jgi:hypothetical protein
MLEGKHMTVAGARERGQRAKLLSIHNSRMPRSINPASGFGLFSCLAVNSECSVSQGFSGSRWKVPGENALHARSSKPSTKKAAMKTKLNQYKRGCFSRYIL